MTHDHKSFLKNWTKDRNIVKLAPKKKQKRINLSIIVADKAWQMEFFFQAPMHVPPGMQNMKLENDEKNHAPYFSTFLFVLFAKRCLVKTTKYQLFIHPGTLT